MPVGEAASRLSCADCKVIFEKSFIATMYDVSKNKLSSDSHSNPLKRRRLE